MKYLCLAYGSREAMERLSAEQFAALVERCKAHDAEMRRSGKVESATSLEWTAVTMRRRAGRLETIDGPFIESKEQIGGVVIIEAADLAEATRIAALHPAAHLGEELGWGIEVRPIAAGCHQ